MPDAETGAPLRALLILLCALGVGELVKWGLKFVTFSSFGAANVDAAPAVVLGIVLFLSANWLVVTVIKR